MEQQNHRKDQKTSGQDNGGLAAQPGSPAIEQYKITTYSNNRN